MGPSGNILVVEDQESARDSLVDLLRGEGYDVHEAADGNQGIAKINQLDLDVVLTDLMMPGADGLAVLKHVSEFSPQTLVDPHDRSCIGGDRYRGDPRGRSRLSLKAAGVRRGVAQDSNIS